MAAAEYLIVERESPDLFLITWWDFTGAKRVERASRLDLTQRCDVLTNPDDVPHSLRYKALGMECDARFSLDVPILTDSLGRNSAP